jgi:hypothetical protein
MKMTRGRGITAAALCAVLSACAGRLDGSVPDSGGISYLGSERHSETGSGGAALPPPAAPIPHRAASTIHAYVGDDFADSVFRYPLVNGTLAGQPDSSITGLVHYMSSTVYGDGSVYVLTAYAGGPTVVSVYAPGATGNATPIRTLSIGLALAWIIVLDAQGYLYVGGAHIDGTEYALVYAPGAGGGDPPVASVQAVWDVSGLAIDKAGNLIIDWNGAQVYANPTSNPVMIRRICFPVVYSGGIAASSKGMYILARHRAIVLNIDANGCPAPRHTFISGGLSYPVGATVEGGSLFVVNGVAPPSQSTIVQLNARRFGEQTPINVVSGAPLQRPRDIHFGP